MKVRIRILWIFSGFFDQLEQVLQVILFKFRLKQPDWLNFFCENTGFVVSELVVASGEQQNTLFIKTNCK